MLIRNVETKDLNDILKLNNENTPAVSDLDMPKLEKLIEMADFTWVIDDQEKNKIAGFCIVFSPNTDYQSANYQWVCKNYSEFQYLDRVVVSNDYQGRGLGKELYAKWFELSPNLPLLLEVNTKPRNEGSIRFHEKLGFSSVGEQDTEGGSKRVQFMARS